MKKKFAILFTVAIAAITMIACQSGSNSPEAVAKTFFKKLAAKDIDGAAKLATKESQSFFAMIKKGMEMAKDSKEAEKITADFKDLTFGTAKMESDSTATVAVTNSKEKEAAKETMNIPMKKENGSWKVDFNIATMMKMGKEQGADMGEMDDLKMEDLDKIGDSITNMSAEELKKGMDAAADAIKEIDPKKLEEIKKTVDELKKQ